MDLKIIGKKDLEEHKNWDAYLEYIQHADTGPLEVRLGFQREKPAFKEGNYGATVLAGGNGNLSNH